MGRHSEEIEEQMERARRERNDSTTEAVRLTAAGVFGLSGLLAWLAERDAGPVLLAGCVFCLAWAAAGWMERARRG